MRRFPSRIAILLTLLLGIAGIANAQCSGTTTITCTGGTSAHVQYDRADNVNTATAADHYPSTITVPGTVTGTVIGVTIKLNNYVALFSAPTPHGNAETSSARMGLLLVHGGTNLEIMNSIGSPASTGQNIPILTIQDGAANGLMPTSLQGCAGGLWNQTASIAYSPTSNFNSITLGSNTYPSPAPAISHAASGHGRTDCTTLVHTATPNTLAGVFAGATASGDWSLYLVNNSMAADVSFSSWELDLTVSATATSTTTSLTSSVTTVFTSSPSNTTTLTATVTGSGSPTGTVTFKDGSTNLTCNSGNPVTLSGGSAACTTSFSTEGLHVANAVYNGDATNITSQGSTNVFAENHSGNTGNSYCNAGAISGGGSSQGSFTNIVPYPSVIFVGDGVNQDIANSVSTVSVQLKNFSETGGGANMHLLLVSPDGNHSFDFWGDAAGGGVSSGNYILQDGGPQLANGGIVAPGTYGPTSYLNTDAFTPAPPAPAPQLPASFSLAAPAGTSTFQTAFVGATSHGAWTLWVYNASGNSDTTNIGGGWCLNISPASGHPTTVTVTSNPVLAIKGSVVQFTATVSSSPSVGNTGTVSFTENGAPLIGVANSGVVSVSGGTAVAITTQLPEGDHTISALYHDSSNTFNDNFGTVTMRVDAATSTPTLSAGIWSYCNPNGIVIPRGVNFVDDIGAAAPNPSNVFVSNLYGTVNTVSLTLKGWHLTSPADLESLLVGPNGVSLPATAQTLDFFSHTGGSGGSTAFGPQDTTFADGFSAVSATLAPGPQDAPTNRGATSYFASPFYTLPGTLQLAGPQGAFTFNNGPLTASSGGVYANTNPNGAWSVYFNQLIHHSGDGAGSWCMNFVENQVAVGATKGHIGSAPSNHFVQGEQGAKFTIDLTNNGVGPTGDPDGNHPLTVTDTLDASFAYVSFTGSGWSCSPSGQVIICVNHNAIAQGNSYPTLTLTVNVSNTATTGPVSNQALVSGGGAANTSASDSVTIDPAPVLSVTKGHTGTFTQGQTAVWNITVNNTAAGSNTNGTTTVTDTLPAGYTIASVIGTGWSCTGSSTLNCTSSQVVAGGASFNQISVTVNVPADSPTSVTNTAGAFGGGDLNHTTSGTAASGSDSSVPVVQVPAHVALTSGNGQSTPANNPFANPLVATVTDAGNVAIPNYPLAFSAPGSGASALFSNSLNTITINTNSSGASSASVSANGTAGGYSVSATAGTISNSFSLTNLGVPAVITNVTSTAPNGTYGAAAVIPIVVTFNKAVNVAGTPMLALNSGGIASYFSGSGTANLTFSYTVGAGQNSTTLDASSSSALSLNGGTINDTSNTPANLTLPAPGSAGSLSVNKTIVIDTVAPTVVSYNVLFGSQSFNLTTSTRNRLPWQIAGIRVVFSEPIATASTASIGGVTATGLSGVGTNTLTWTISPLVLGNFATTLAGDGANAIKDAAGNALSGGAGFSKSVKVLYGDFNDDGVVNASDGVLVNNARSAPYNLFADMNGDGVVDVADVSIARSRIGTSLP